MTEPKVAIIILNWNGKKHLETCLSFLLEQTYSNYKIFLVDNGSTDGSLEYLEHNFSNNKKIQVISLPKNTGFAEGNNIALAKINREKKYKYIATLNNDTKVNEHWLEKMIEVAEQDDNIGSVAPKVKFFIEPHLMDSTGIVVYPDGGGMNRGFKEKDQGQYNKQEEVFGSCAGAALYRKAAIDKAGFFDKNFFAYYEDLDLAWRLRHAGYKTIYTPEAMVHHVHSATGISHSPFKAYHVQRNRLLVILKNFPFFMMLKAFFWLTPKRYLHLVNSALGKKQGPAYKLKSKTSFSKLIFITLKAWLSFCVLFFPTLFKRWGIKKDSVLTKQWFEKYSADFDKMIYL